MGAMIKVASLMAIGLAVVACGQRSRSEIWAGASYFVPDSASHNSNTAVDPVSHRLRHAQSVWSFADSAAWAHQRDSLLTAITQLGGSPVVCETTPAKRGFANVLYWRSSGLYLKVRAEKINRDFHGSMPWIVSLEAFPHMPYECLNAQDRGR
jgi:hypothetical protein